MDQPPGSLCDDATVPWLAGGGAVGALMRGVDWAATPMGPPRGWPQSLRSMISVCLNSPVLGAVLWGPDLLFFYNDAYVPSLGERHPAGLGQPVAQVWGAAWDEVSGPFYRAMQTGEGFSQSMVPLSILRHGVVEETWWDFTAAPIRGEDGSIVGLFNQGVEVTAQVKARRDLEHESRRLAQMFESAPSFMAMVEGAEHRFVLTNAAYVRLVGRTDLVGRRLADTLPDAADQGYVGILDEVFRSGEAYRAQAARYDVRPVPGGPVSEHFVDFVFQPVVDADGVVTGIFIEGFDVTGRVRANQAMRESQQRLDQALSAGQGIGTWDWDVRADLVKADERFARLYGVDPHLARQGAPIATFFPRIHPEDMPRVQAAIDRSLANGALFDEEYRLVQEDGQIVWLVAQGQCILSPTGQPLHFPGVSFDITARKNAEQRKSALLDLSEKLRHVDSIADMEFAGAEALGRGLGVSRAGYGTVDTAAETITVQRDWNAPGIRTIAGMLRFRDHGSYIEDIKRGETVAIGDVDKDPRTSDKASVLRAISARAFINMPLVEQGDFVALAYVNDAGPRVWGEDDLFFMQAVAERVRAATERRRQALTLALLNETLEEQVTARTQELMMAEDALRQAQKMEAVGQLTGGIAHDFNNLLQGITGSLDIIARRVKQGRFGEIDRFLEGASTAATRAAALTQRLLAFSRRQPLAPRAVQVDDLMTSVDDMLRRTLGEHIVLDLAPTRDLWLTLCDPNQLENAVLNLCINARDAMPGGGRLTVATGNLALGEPWQGMLPGDWVSLAVTDTGMGMSAQTMARAFEPFFTTKPVGQGTGLGLSMIYGFARQSGGHVRIASQEGRGTTVTLYLPRCSGDTEAECAPADDARHHGADAGEVVLVVEDEAVVRGLIVDVLRDLGYRALEADDGPAGLRMLQAEGRIDLLVTDIGLPGMNGRQVVEAARRVRPDLKVLFMTGYAENAAQVEGFLEPGMAMMTKPFAIEAMAGRIRAMIEEDGPHLV